MPATLNIKTVTKRTKHGTISLKFTAEGEGISSKIFAIEVLPKSADKVAPYYRFSHICSATELIEFPEDEPRDCCYFRVGEIEMLFDTDLYVDKVIANMVADAAKLTREFNDLYEAEEFSDSFIV